MAAAGGRSIASGGAGWLRADGACGALPEVMINKPCGGGAFAVAIILPEGTVTRSGVLRPGTVRRGRPHAAALAPAARPVGGSPGGGAGAAPPRGQRAPCPA